MGGMDKLRYLCLSQRRLKATQMTTTRHRVAINGQFVYGVNYKIVRYATLSGDPSWSGHFQSIIPKRLIRSGSYNIPFSSDNYAYPKKVFVVV